MNTNCDPLNSYQRVPNKDICGVFLQKSELCACLRLVTGEWTGAFPSLTHPHNVISFFTIQLHRNIFYTAAHIDVQQHSCYFNAIYFVLEIKYL